MAAAVVIPTVTKLAVGEKHMATPACGLLREFQGDSAQAADE
jgi:hypothetical protein